MTLVKRGLTSPIQGWQYPHIFHRDAAPTAMFAGSGTSASILFFIPPVGANGALMYHTHQSGTSTLVDPPSAGTSSGS